MAAIDIHIGTQDPTDRKADAASCAASGLGDARTCTPSIEQLHRGQTRMVWVRQALTEWAAKEQIRYQLVVKAGRLGFEIDPQFHADLFPWLMDKATQGQTFFGLIGEAAKMGCPTWDLPAGAPELGGTCPGAKWGQSTVPLQIRKAKGSAAVGQPVRLRETICQICYAEGGNYATFTIQLGELFRYWWTKDLLEKNPAAWVETMIEAIGRTRFPVERHRDPRDPTKPLLPFRIHSSGDFFSFAYAEAWIALANQLPDVTFWAPTRTWAASKGWVEFWRKHSHRIEHENLIVRPSAYHTDDPAPDDGDRMVPCQTGGDTAEPHTELRPETPWGPGEYPFTGAGSTAIYKFNDLGKGKDPRYDWPCGTYAIVDDRDSCFNAIGPDGKKACRACWVRPELRINYTAH